LLRRANLSAISSRLAPNEQPCWDLANSKGRPPGGSHE
jgi:hypothetical protein